VNENKKLLNSEKELANQLEKTQKAMGQLGLDFGVFTSTFAGQMVEGTSSKAKFEYLHGALSEARLQLGTIHKTNTTIIKELEDERNNCKQKEDDFRRKEAKLQKELTTKENEIKTIYQRKIDTLVKEITQKDEEISKVKARLETRELVYKDAISENTSLRSHIITVEKLLKISPTPNLILVDEISAYSKKVHDEVDKLRAFITKFFDQEYQSLDKAGDIDSISRVTAATTEELRKYLNQIIQKLNISSSAGTSRDISLINEAERLKRLLNPYLTKTTQPPKRPRTMSVGGLPDNVIDVDEEGARGGVGNKTKAPLTEDRGSKKQKTDPKK